MTYKSKHVVKNGKKICSECNKYKPIGEFYKNRFNKSGYSHCCKKCVSVIRKKYPNHRSKESQSKQNMIKRASKRGFKSASDLENFIQSKNSRCEICGMTREFSKKFFKKDLCIDHCHSTNKNRGVLCISCNFAVGHLNDDPIRAYNTYKCLERVN